VSDVFTTAYLAACRNHPWPNSPNHPINLAPDRRASGEVAARAAAAELKSELDRLGGWDNGAPENSPARPLMGRLAAANTWVEAFANANRR
jgi:hypothetical protein